MAQFKMNARTSTFGDYGASRHCWNAWSAGRQEWERHARSCSECRETINGIRARENRAPLR